MVDCWLSCLLEFVTGLEGGCLMVKEPPVEEFGRGMAPFGLAHRDEFLAEFIEMEIPRCGLWVYLQEAMFSEKMMNHPGGRLRLASHHEVDDGSGHLQLSPHSLEILE